MTDKLNVPANVLDVPIDLIRTKSGGRTAPLPPLGHANAFTLLLLYFYFTFTLLLLNFYFTVPYFYPFNLSEVKTFQKT